MPATPRHRLPISKRQTRHRQMQATKPAVVLLWILLFPVFVGLWQFPSRREPITAAEPPLPVKSVPSGSLDGGCRSW